MNDSNTLPQEYIDPTQYAQRERLSPFSLLVAPFIILAVSVSMVPGLNIVVIVVGALLAAAFAVSLVMGRYMFPPELFCLIFFVAWAYLGGFVAPNQLAFIYRIRTLLQVLLMVVIIMNSSQNLKTARFLLLSFLAGCAIVAGSAYVTGAYLLAELGEERAAGLAMNANLFSFILIYSTITLCYFFASWKSKILKVGCLLALLGVGRLVISTGSREGFFSFLLILFFWFIFTYKKLIRQKPTMFIFLGIIITLVGLFFVMSLADTIMGERLEEGFESTTDSDLLRQNMYIQAIGLTIRNPVLGVGVDNFGVVTGIGTYAHSNYVETSSTTGIPGFVSYYLAFAFLWFRLWRLGKMPLEMKAKTLVNAAQAFMLVRFASDLTRVSYFSKINWIFFAILIGWSYSMEKQLKQDAEYLQEDEFSEPEPYPDESEAQYMET